MAHFDGQLLASLATIRSDMTGDEARALRQGMGLSAAKLGALIGTNESTVYRFERRAKREVPRMYEYALRYLLGRRAEEGEGDLRKRPPPARSANSK